MRNLKNLLLAGIILFVAACGNEDASVAESGGTGIAGSFASFIIVDDYLYAIYGTSIHTYIVAANGELTFSNALPLDANLETLFPYGDMLLVGSQQGVFFLDRTTPSAPEFISVYRHITACDPVVAKGNIAYSTLRATRCNIGDVEQVDVIDFSNIENPFVVRSYSSINPLGLGIRGNFLFLCENDGVTMYDISDPVELREMGRISFDGATALDVIPADQYLIVTTNRGIYNVLFTDVGDLNVAGQVTSD